MRVTTSRIAYLVPLVLGAVLLTASATAFGRGPRLPFEDRRAVSASGRLYALQHGDRVAAMTSFHLLVAAKPEDLRARLVAALKAGSPIKDAISLHLGVYPH